MDFKVGQTLFTLFYHGNRKEKVILDFAKTLKLFWKRWNVSIMRLLLNYLAKSFEDADITSYLLNGLTHTN